MRKSNGHSPLKQCRTRARPSLTWPSLPQLAAFDELVDQARAYSSHLLDLFHSGHTNYSCLKHPYHLNNQITSTTNAMNTATPPQKIHLSCFALLSTILMVSPLTPSVVATSYNLLCVPFSISLCWPRSPNTALPRSRNSSI